MPSEKDIVITIRAQSSGLEQEFARVRQSTQQLAHGVQSTNGVLQASTATSTQLATSLGTIRPHAQTATGALGHLSQTSGQAATQLGTVRSQAQTSSTAMRSVGQAAQTTAQHVRTMGTATTATSSSLTSGIASLKNYAAGYLTIQAAIAGVKAVVTQGFGMERLDRSFAAIAGNAAAGAKELDFLRATAARLGMDFQALAEGYKGISAASMGTTMEGQKMRDLFMAIVEAGRALGMSSEAVRGSLRAVTQMMSTGTIQADELKNELGNHLPGALAIFSRAVGMSTRDFMKLMEAGNAISDEVLPKVARELMGGIVESMKTAGGSALTAEQNFTKFGSTMKQVFADIGGSHFFTTVLKGLGKLADEIDRIREARERLNKFETGEGRKIVDSAAAGLTLPPAVQPKLEAEAATMAVNLRRARENLKALEDTANDPKKQSGGGQFIAGVPVAEFTKNITLARAELTKLEQQLLAFEAKVKKAAIKSVATQEDFMVRPELLEERGQKELDFQTKTKAATEDAASIIKRAEAYKASITGTMSAEELNKAVEKFYDAEIKKFETATQEIRAKEAAVAPSLPAAPIPASTSQQYQLDPLAAAKAALLIQRAAAEGMDLRVTSGRRSAEEQARLYAQGRTTPGNIVTNAPPGTSYHETGRAFDVAPFVNGQPDWASPKWDRIGAMGREAGLQWGGDFTSFKDRPHFQLPKVPTLTRAPLDQQALFQQAGQRYGQDPFLLEAMAFRESSFTPGKTSLKGAQGLMQVMPETQKDLGVTDPFNIEQSVMGAGKYLEQLFTMFHGDTEKMLAAYHGGMGRLESVGGDVTKMPVSTQAYVKNVLASQRELQTGGVAMASTSQAAAQGSATAALADLAARRNSARDAVDFIQGETKALEERAKVIAANSEEIAQLSQRFRENTDALESGKSGMDQWERATDLARLQALGAGEMTMELARGHDAAATALEKLNQEMEDAIELGRNWKQVQEDILSGGPEMALVREGGVDDAGQPVPGAKSLLDDDPWITPSIGFTQDLNDMNAGLDALQKKRQDIQGYFDSGFTVSRSLMDASASGSQLANEEGRLRTLQAQLPEVERNSEAFRLLKREIAETRQNITEFSAASSKAWMDFAQTATEQILKLMDTSATFRDAMASLFASIAEGLAKMVQGLSEIDWGAILSTVVKVAGSVVGAPAPPTARGGFIAADHRRSVGEEGSELFVTSKSLRLVGTHGPEIIRPTEPGLIVPHQQTMTILRRNAAYLTPPMMQATARQALAARRSTAEPLVGLPVSPILRRSLPGVLAQWTPPGMAPADAARATARLMPQDGARSYETVIPNMAKREQGGPVAQGGTYLAGEGGMELMLGAASTRGMGSAGGKAGGNTTNVHLHLHDVRDAPSFVRSRSQISRAMRGIVQDGGMGGDGR